MTNRWTSTDPLFLAAFGEAVRRRREQAGLERKDLAETAGISYSYLSAIESGQKLPSGAIQTDLANALGVGPSELLAEANRASDESLPSDVFAARLAPPEPLGRLDFPSASMRAHSLSGEVSASGAAAEINALLPLIDTAGRQRLLWLARQLADDPTSRERRVIEERRRSRSKNPELRTAAYQDIWIRYIEALDRQGLDWAENRQPEPRSYFTTPSPIRGTSFSASFARNRMIRHELYINRGSREANLELLDDFRDDRRRIEAVYGRPLDFEDPGRERRAVRLAEYRHGHVLMTDEFDDYVDWFIDCGVRLRRALEPFE